MIGRVDVPLVYAQINVLRKIRIFREHYLDVHRLSMSKGKGEFGRTKMRQRVDRQRDARLVERAGRSGFGLVDFFSHWNETESKMEGESACVTSFRQGSSQGFLYDNPGAMYIVLYLAKVNRVGGRDNESAWEMRDKSLAESEVYGIQA